MWTKISNGTENGYYMKYHHEDDGYVFFLTDFVRIWKSSCDKQFLEKLLTDQNPLLGGDESSLLNSAVELLFDGLSNGSTKSTFQLQDDGHLHVDFTVSNDGYTLKLPLSFDAAQPETYCQEVTIPLIENIMKCRESENSLTSLLSKKDIEISEYKAEGARLSLKHYETKKFDPTNHKEKFQFNESFFQILPDVNDFLNVKLGISKKVIKEDNCDKPKMKMKMKTEKIIKIKNEPFSQPLKSKTLKIPSTSSKSRKNKLNF